MMTQIKQITMTKTKYGSKPASVAICLDGENEYLAQGTDITVFRVKGNFDVTNLYTRMPKEQICPFASNEVSFQQRGNTTLVDMGSDTFVYKFYGRLLIRVIYTLRGEINIVLIELR